MEPKHEITEKQPYTCAIVRDLLPLDEDGALSRESARFLKTHLDGCPACRQYKRLLRQQERPSEGPDELPVPKADAGYAAIAKRYRRNRRRLLGTVGLVCIGCVTSAIYHSLKDEKK